MLIFKCESIRIRYGWFNFWFSASMKILWGLWAARVRVRCYQLGTHSGVASWDMISNLCSRRWESWDNRGFATRDSMHGLVTDRFRAEEVEDEEISKNKGVTQPSSW